MRHPGGERITPEHEQAQDHERDFDQTVPQQEDIENATRIIAERLNEFGQARMITLQAAQLMRLQGKKGGLQAGKEG